MGMLPRSPTFQELAKDALGGDADAAFELARRAPDKGFLPWLSRWVPEGEMTPPTFNTFADAYALMELDKRASRKGA